VRVVGRVDGWIAMLAGVAGKLEQGATVADVGCGGGSTTIALARSYPESRFWGFDDDAAAIAVATASALQDGVADRIRFEVAGPGDFPGTSFDLICQYDRLRAADDPLAAARHTLRALAPDGSWLLVTTPDGETWLRTIAAAAGFTRFRRAGAIADDIVLEGKP
jgi:2-polyprenyl-3-methyl-5-hydroxy-6-metoxy-1,4-benzoquinol methylase